MRLSVMRALIVSAALAVPATTTAQQAGPSAGTWGAEAGLGGVDVSLLRFTSNTSAWLIGFSGFYNKRDEDDGGPAAFDNEATVATLRLGWRGYRTTDSRVRPFTTLAALVGYDDTALGAMWEFGGEFEYGGAYFFTRNVSLGASFDLRAVFGTGTRDNALLGDETDVTTVNVSAGLRFLGAVYF
jgi:hypothetical protein